MEHVVHCAGTCILFGDGCGAVVLTQQEGACGLLGSHMASDGGGQKHLKVRPGRCPLRLAPPATTHPRDLQCTSIKHAAVMTPAWEEYKR